MIGTADLDPNNGLIAILRGITFQDVERIVEELLEAGFRTIEIPLNSEEPFRSIKLAAKIADGQALIGAGTVLTVADVDKLAETGARLVVSPNVDPAVISRTLELGLLPLPGVMTPSEALQALRAGATTLKFFPASVLGRDGITAIRSVLPAATRIAAVGGISELDYRRYLAIGIRIFGLGSSLYKPGDTAESVRQRADTLVGKYKLELAEARDSSTPIDI